MADTLITKLSNVADLTVRPLELAPEFGHALRYLGNIYAAVGDPGKAAPLFERAGHRASLACALARSGLPTEARAILEELQREVRSRYVSPYDLAAVQACLGETKRALALLEEAYRLRIFRLSRMQIDWRFEALRQDARFTDLARRVGLPGPE